ncbi:MAG: penicillin-binding protein 2 [Actinomycetota bacterium]|nr:penicillin-binding protein 2 [Actinomycetota bacterium]
MLVGGSAGRGAIRGGRPGRRRRRDPFARRATAALVVYLLAFVAVGYRLVTVQVVHAAHYAELGEQQRLRTVELPPRRGRIYDREGDVLATSVDAATVYADPRAFRERTGADGLIVPPAGDAAEVAATVAPLLGTTPGAVEAELRAEGHFRYLARQVDHALGQRIAELQLPGIGVLTEPTRVYPAGPLAGQVVGFTGIDGDGLSGLELQYDQLLAGEPGRLALERAPGGLTIASGTRELRPARSGTDLVLTIDREIQHVAERAAAAAVERFDAVGASVVVLEVGSGEVLAMASAPGFDPNRLQESDDGTRRNRAVTDMFEPGSVQKAVTAAAAVEEGIVGPDTVLSVPDRLPWGRKVFSDAHRHPIEDLTLRQIVERSSNIGTILVADQLGPDRLSRYLDAFGYGQPLGIGFPGEVGGGLLPREQWSATSLPTIAIGQGVAVTLLQAAHVYATLADDGVATQPRLLRGVVGDDGRLDPAPQPARHRVISADTARQVRAMLEDVVSGEHGTGGRAAVPGYDVAGKTGTARKPLTGARGYSGEYIASFVGFAPVDDPRMVVAVMVDEPQPIYGGVVAAPTFAEVMRFALAHRRIPPTDPAEADARAAPPPAPDPAGATPTPAATFRGVTDPPVAIPPP